MKKILLSALTIFVSAATFAQSFTTASGSSDTVKEAYVAGSEIKVYNIVTPSSSASPLTLKWKVLSVSTTGSGFDVPSSGLCDNNQCYSPLNTLAANGTVFATSPIISGSAATGDMHAVFGISGTVANGSSIKTTIRVTDTITGYSRTLTFIAYKSALGVPQVNTDENVTLYPNPARDFVNVLYEAKSNIKNIAIYNLIGKTMQVYKVTDDNSAKLDLGNIPSGVYFIRLINAQGQIVTTRRFTRQ